MGIDFTKIRPKNFSRFAYEKGKKAADRVTSGSGNISLQHCPVCKSTERIFYLAKYEIPIFCCNTCELKYAGFHPKNFGDVYSDPDYLDQTLKAYDESREYRKTRFGIERVGLIKKYVKSGSLLDVGCGTGWFIESASKDFSCVGVEYSDDIRAWLQAKLQIDSYQSMDKVPGKFDVITAFDVIEHVPDPVEFLNQIYNLLSDQGLVLIFTPFADSVAFLAGGINNNLICPPQHLHYFNEKSFEYLANLTGFEIIEFQTRGTDMGDILAASEDRLEFDGKFAQSNAGKIQDLFDHLGISNHGRFFLKKK